MKVVAEGKSFLLGGSPFRFRGVRYRLPAAVSSAQDEERLRADLAAIEAAGYTVVSTAPPAQPAIELAAASGLSFLLEPERMDLSAIARASRRERRRLVGDLAGELRRAARMWRSSHALLGVNLGAPRLAQSTPAGARGVSRLVDELAIGLHGEDPGLLVGWQTSWPVDGGCPAEVDFLMVDCEHMSSAELGAAIMGSHSEVGDRPLVLANVSVHGGVASLRSVIDTALSCGAAGTIALQPPSPQPDGPDSEIASTNRRTIGDLDVDWPSISVVINAYNAAATIDECLSHCERLDYPQLEIIVVDDGSSDATAEIVSTHKGARLVTISHEGLSAGRNVGYAAARGELIAYLDADAYPSPQWPWYLALAAMGEHVGGSGGPNVPPSHDPASARVVARCPGGPVPELVDPDLAQHVPGCNMAFWREVLEQLQGFDPVLEGAEDIEFEWRIVESGRRIGYHPAALVWHHRRPGLGGYLRQQRHYGRGQAILERRYPHRFPSAHRVRKATARLGFGRAGASGNGAHPVRYLSLPAQESALVEIAHQWGMPAAALLAATGPLALVQRRLGMPAACASALVAALFVIDVVAAGRDRTRAERKLALTARIAAFRLLRPLAFRWGHLRAWHELRTAPPQWPAFVSTMSSADADRRRP